MIKNERGVSPIIEATIYLPICIISLMAMLYATIFLTVQANMQATLQDAIIYFKNQESDTYVYTRSELNFGDVNEADYYYVDGIKSPFRLVFMRFNDNDCVNFIRKLSGYMFFSNNTNMKVKAERSNYIISKKIRASAEVSFTPLISLSKSRKRTLRASASMVITDGDEIIRTVDMIDDMTGFSEDIQSALDGVTDIYRKFRDVIMK